MFFVLSISFFTLLWKHLNIWFNKNGVSWFNIAFIVYFTTWINSFCLPDIDIDNTICICYNKDNSKPDKQKTSNQFPKLVIYETGYDIHNLMPILHQFVDKLILKVKV